MPDIVSETDDPPSTTPSNETAVARQAKPRIRKAVAGAGQYPIPFYDSPDLSNSPGPLAGEIRLVDSVTTVRPAAVREARVRPLRPPVAANQAHEKSFFFRNYNFPENEQARAFRKRFFPDATRENWSDWGWQVRHRIRTVEQLTRIFQLSPVELDAVQRHRGALTTPRCCP